MVASGRSLARESFPASNSLGSTEALIRGGPADLLACELGELSVLLGNSVNITQKHYAPLVKVRRGVSLEADVKRVYELTKDPVV